MYNDAHEKAVLLSRALLARRVICCIRPRHRKVLSAPELITLAKANSPKASSRGRSHVRREGPEKEGTAWSGHGSDFFFAVSATSAPSLVIDEKTGEPMQQISGTNLWYASAHIEPLGHMHQFHYLIGSASFGGRLDMPAFGPLSYIEPGTPTGTLSDKLIHTSKIYDGMKSDYWIYVPAQYDPKVPAAVMVFQDGDGYIHRDGNNPALNVIDNLIARRKFQ